MRLTYDIPDHSDLAEFRTAATREGWTGALEVVTSAANPTGHKSHTLTLKLLRSDGANITTNYDSKGRLESGYSSLGDPTEDPGIVLSWLVDGFLV